MSEITLRNGEKIRSLRNGMEFTTMPSGLEVITFPTPPARFQPLKADEEQLLRYGFPRRPVEYPELMPRWEAVMSRNLQYIRPTFRRLDNIRHGPRRRDVTAGTETSDNWSGAVVFAPSGAKISWLEGTWTIPDPYPRTSDGTQYFSASWIGIDGDGSADVCQAGIECDAMAAGNSTQRNIYPWWEWFPEVSIQVTNFPIAAGDVVSCVICTTSDNTATVFFRNVNSNNGTSFQITAPDGTTLVGNSAEWIVEAPEVNNSIASLADYGSVYFDDAIASTDTKVLLEGGTGDSISLVSGGKSLSTGILELPRLIKCDFTG